MEVIEGSKGDNDNSDDSVVEAIIYEINPWDYIPPFDMLTCNRIKDLARCAPKKAVKVAIFGTKEFTDDEQREFDQYYTEGSAEGEVAIGVKLFSQAMAGDNKSIDQYLQLKAHWSKESGPGEDGDDEVGLNIFLSNGSKDE